LKVLAHGLLQLQYWDFPGKNNFGSEVSTRGCVRASIMQFSLEPLLGAATSSVAGML